MLEGFVWSIVERYASIYVQGFKPEEVKISLWEGLVELNNIVLNTDAFNLPVKVSRGTIRKLQARIPWTNLQERPIVVHVDGLVLEVVANSQFSADNERPDNVPLQLPSTADTDNFSGRLRQSIVDNLTVIVRDIHIHFREPSLQSVVRVRVDQIALRPESTAATGTASTSASSSAANSPTKATSSTDSATGTNTGGSTRLGGLADRIRHRLRDSKAKSRGDGAASSTRFESRVERDKDHVCAICSNSPESMSSSESIPFWSADTMIEHCAHEGFALVTRVVTVQNLSIVVDEIGADIGENVARNFDETTRVSTRTTSTEAAVAAAQSPPPLKQRISDLVRSKSTSSVAKENAAKKAAAAAAVSTDTLAQSWTVMDGDENVKSRTRSHTVSSGINVDIRIMSSPSALLWAEVRTDAPIEMDVRDIDLNALSLAIAAVRQVLVASPDSRRNGEGDRRDGNGAESSDDVNGAGDARSSTPPPRTEEPYADSASAYDRFFNFDDVSEIWHHSEWIWGGVSAQSAGIISPRDAAAADSGGGGSSGGGAPGDRLNSPRSSMFRGCFVRASLAGINVRLSQHVVVADDDAYDDDDEEEDNEEDGDSAVGRHGIGGGAVSRPTFTSLPCVVRRAIIGLNAGKCVVELTALSNVLRVHAEMGARDLECVDLWDTADSTEPLVRVLHAVKGVGGGTGADGVAVHACYVHRLGVQPSVSVDVGALHVQVPPLVINRLASMLEAFDDRVRFSANDISDAVDRLFNESEQAPHEAAAAPSESADAYVDEDAMDATIREQLDAHFRRLAFLDLQAAIANIEATNGVARGGGGDDDDEWVPRMRVRVHVERPHIVLAPRPLDPDADALHVECDSFVLSNFYDQMPGSVYRMTAEGTHVSLAPTGSTSTGASFEFVTPTLIETFVCSDESMGGTRYDVEIEELHFNFEKSALERVESVMQWLARQLTLEEGCTDLEPLSARPDAIIDRLLTSSTIAKLESRDTGAALPWRCAWRPLRVARAPSSARVSRTCITALVHRIDIGVRMRAPGVVDDTVEKMERIAAIELQQVTSRIVNVSSMHHASLRVHGSCTRLCVNDDSERARASTERAPIALLLIEANANADSGAQADAEPRTPTERTPATTTSRLAPATLFYTPANQNEGVDDDLAAANVDRTLIDSVSALFPSHFRPNRIASLLRSHSTARTPFRQAGLSASTSAFGPTSVLRDTSAASPRGDARARRLAAVRLSFGSDVETNRHGAVPMLGIRLVVASPRITLLRPSFDKLMTALVTTKIAGLPAHVQQRLESLSGAALRWHYLTLRLQRARRERIRARLLYVDASSALRPSTLPTWRFDDAALYAVVRRRQLLRRSVLDSVLFSWEDLSLYLSSLLAKLNVSIDQCVVRFDESSVSSSASRAVDVTIDRWCIDSKSRERSFAFGTLLLRGEMRQVSVWLHDESCARRLYDDGEKKRKRALPDYYVQFLEEYEWNGNVESKARSALDSVLVVHKETLVARFSSELNPSESSASLVDKNDPLTPGGPDSTETSAEDGVMNAVALPLRRSLKTLDVYLGGGASFDLSVERLASLMRVLRGFASGGGERLAANDDEQRRDYFDTEARFASVDDASAAAPSADAWIGRLQVRLYTPSASVRVTSTRNSSERRDESAAEWEETMASLQLDDVCLLVSTPEHSRTLAANEVRTNVPGMFCMLRVGSVHSLYRAESGVTHELLWSVDAHKGKSVRRRRRRSALSIEMATSTSQALSSTVHHSAHWRVSMHSCAWRQPSTAFWQLYWTLSGGVAADNARPSSSADNEEGTSRSALSRVCLALTDSFERNSYELELQQCVALLDNVLIDVGDLHVRARLGILRATLGCGRAHACSAGQLASANIDDNVRCLLACNTLEMLVRARRDRLYDRSLMRATTPTAVTSAASLATSTSSSVHLSSSPSTIEVLNELNLSWSASQVDALLNVEAGVGVRLSMRDATLSAVLSGDADGTFGAVHMDSSASAISSVVVFGSPRQWLSEVAAASVGARRRAIVEPFGFAARVRSRMNTGSALHVDVTMSRVVRLQLCPERIGIVGATARWLGLLATADGDGPVAADDAVDSHVDLVALPWRTVACTIGMQGGSECVLSDGARALVWRCARSEISVNANVLSHDTADVLVSGSFGASSLRLRSMHMFDAGRVDRLLCVGRFGEFEAQDGGLVSATVHVSRDTSQWCGDVRNLDIRLGDVVASADASSLDHALRVANAISDAFSRATGGGGAALDMHDAMEVRCERNHRMRWVRADAGANMAVYVFGWSCDRPLCDSGGAASTPRFVCRMCAADVCERCALDEQNCSVRLHNVRLATFDIELSMRSFPQWFADAVPLLRSAPALFAVRGASARVGPVHLASSVRTASGAMRTFKAGIIGAPMGLLWRLLAQHRLKLLLSFVASLEILGAPSNALAEVRRALRRFARDRSVIRLIRSVLLTSRFSCGHALLAWSRLFAHFGARLRTWGPLMRWCAWLSEGVAMSLRGVYSFTKPTVMVVADGRAKSEENRQCSSSSIAAAAATR